MKFCPCCGVELLKRDAVFCVECGVRLSGEEQRKKSQKASVGKCFVKNKQVKGVPAEEKITVDDGYDGYYDDVLPPDLDREKEELNRELIKKIVALGVGFVCIIAMCVVMMYVL